MLSGATGTDLARVDIVDAFARPAVVIEDPGLHPSASQRTTSSVGLRDLHPRSHCPVSIGSCQT